jgi:imidazolonepropionase-like amidohydrolase
MSYRPSIGQFGRALLDRRFVGPAIVFFLVGVGLVGSAEFLLPRLRFPETAVDVVLSAVLFNIPIALGVCWRLRRSAGGEPVPPTLPLVALLLVAVAAAWLGIRALPSSEALEQLSRGAGVDGPGSLPFGRMAVDSALLITNVTVIDGSDAPPRENVAILIQSERIIRVAALEEIAVPDDAVRYDARGRFAIPGLWDMHTHVLWQPFVGDGFLGLFIGNGVTGIRDMGGTLEVVRAVRPGGSLHSPSNPRIVAAGPWLNPTELDPRAGIAVETPEAAREAVATLADGGVDFIKVYLQLTREVFLAVLEAAEEHGLDVAGHVPLEIGSLEASDLGMRSIEHMRAEIGGFCEEVGPTDCEELFSAFRRNGTWQTPTLHVRWNRAHLDRPALWDDPDLAYAPGYLSAEWEGTRLGRIGTESFDEVRERYASERELAGAIHRARVPILAGSDAGEIYSLAGFSIHDELELLVQAGVSPREALRAATLGPAEYLGATDSLGTIAEGKLADLVLLDEDPLQDIRNTRRIRAVVREGRLYDRAELDRLLAGIAAAAGTEDRPSAKPPADDAAQSDPPSK